MNTAQIESAIETIVRLRGKVPRRTGRVSLELRGSLAEIVLDNPLDRHAMTLGMMEDLGRIVRRLRDWDGAIVLLRASTPDGFCSGGHLEEVKSIFNTSAAGANMSRAMTTICDALSDLPQVTVSVVSGPAVGGGAELTTATDHRVFTETAYVQFVQASLGVATGWGGARRLLNLVGRPVATRWLTTSGKVGAKVALSVGFADRVFAGDPREAALEFVKPVAGLPVDGVRAVKRQIAAALRNPPDMDAEGRAFVDVWGGPAHLRSLGS